MFFSLSNMTNNSDKNANNISETTTSYNNINGNGYRLLSAQGMETLQTFLKEHGNECIKQFVKVYFRYLLFLLYKQFPFKTLITSI